MTPEAEGRGVKREWEASKSRSRRDWCGWVAPEGLGKRSHAQPLRTPVLGNPPQNASWGELEKWGHPAEACIDPLTLRPEQPVAGERGPVLVTAGPEGGREGRKARKNFRVWDGVC